MKVVIAFKGLGCRDKKNSKAIVYEMTLRHIYFQSDNIKIHVLHRITGNIPYSFKYSET